MTDREKFEVVPLAEVWRKTRNMEQPSPESTEEELPHKDPQPSSPQYNTIVKMKVFVVDDEALIADTLATILQSKGYDARPFYNAESALAGCESGAPECVISDVVMPGMSGFDLAVRLKAQIPVCRVILFSGQAATSDVLESARRTGHEFELLTKPVHPTEMLARLAMSKRRVPTQDGSAPAGIWQ